MKGKLLAFPFISFAESGLFNGLWRIQIKKSPHAELASRVVLHSRSQTPYLCPLLRLTLRAIFRWRENVITYFYLCKDNAGPCCVSCRGTGTRSLGGGPAVAKEGVGKRSGHSHRAPTNSERGREPNVEMPTATGRSRFFRRAPELSQRLGFCRRSALEPIRA
jgi:hypothetical protein